MIIKAARSRPTAFVAVLAVAGTAWWTTAERMAGMDAGPGTDPGPLAWFVGVWAVMMAAMMLPSFAPTAAIYAHLLRRRDPSGWLLFTAGYLCVWIAAGLVAYSLFVVGRTLFERTEVGADFRREPALVDELPGVEAREGEEDFVDELDGRGRPFNVEQDGARQSLRHEEAQARAALSRSGA